MFEEARALFVEIAAPRDRGGNVAVVAALTNNIVYMSSNYACHAGLNGLLGRTSSSEHRNLTKPIQYGLDNPSKAQVVFSYVMAYKASLEDMVMFADWMVKESPWKETFLNKDGADVMADRVWLANPLVSQNMLAGGLIATRLPTEFHSHFTVWLRLAKLGVNKTLAYLIATFATGKDSIFFTLPSGHIPIACDFSISWIKNFLDHNPVHKDAVSYAVRNGYGGVSQMWGKGSGYGRGQFSLLEKIVPKSKATGNNYDIFQQNKTGNWKFETDDDLIDMAKQVEQIVRQ